jgi:hypothetical protein
VAEDRVVDLMAALEASVREAKEARKRHPAASPSAADANDDEPADAAPDAADDQPARGTKAAGAGKAKGASKARKAAKRTTPAKRAKKSA